MQRLCLMMALLVCLMVLPVRAVGCAGEVSGSEYSFTGVIDDSGALSGSVVPVSVGRFAGYDLLGALGGVASKLDYGVHYVGWGDGNSTYSLAYSSDLSWVGTEFVGTSVEVVTIQAGAVGESPSWSVSTDDDFSFSPGSALVYSDLGQYPQLVERGGKDYAQTACIILCSFGLFYLFRSMFTSRGNRW